MGVSVTRRFGVNTLMAETEGVSVTRDNGSQRVNESSLSCVLSRTFRTLFIVRNETLAGDSTHLGSKSVLHVQLT